jgi:hypothetical protein
MKKLLIIPMLLSLLIFARSLSCHSSRTKTILTSNTDYENIIGRPIKLDNLEVAQHDFPKSMNWDDAKAACAKLGEGWRLPTKDELNLLYQKKDKIGGFAEYFYWSSTEYINNDAWLKNFNIVGSQRFSNIVTKFGVFNVRAVRSL